jgi:hypothetical protein
MSKHISFLVRD